MQNKAYLVGNTTESMKRVARRLEIPQMPWGAVHLLAVGSRFDSGLPAYHDNEENGVN